MLPNSTAEYPASTPCPEDEKTSSIYVPEPPAPTTHEPAYPTKDSYPEVPPPAPTKEVEQPKPQPPKGGGYSSGGRIVTNGNTSLGLIR